MRRCWLNCSVAALTLLAALALFRGQTLGQEGANLLPDPSIEEVQPKNQYGIPYGKWRGWVFEGPCEFRNAKLARRGETCAEIIGAPDGKIRLFSPAVTVGPGRYRFTCYIRGLDIGRYAQGASADVNFADGRYYALKKTGTFGWTRLEIIKDVPARQEIAFRIGLWAPGRLWVDDAELVRVPEDIPLTQGPVLGPESPIHPPG